MRFLIEPTRPEPPVQPRRGELMTQLDAARACHVGLRVVDRWIETGAWPLPCAVRGVDLCYEPRDVAGWLETGAWPGNARFLRGDA